MAESDNLEKHRDPGNIVYLKEKITNYILIHFKQGFQQVPDML
jgi:hypothetical protein